MVKKQALSERDQLEEAYRSRSAEDFLLFCLGLTIASASGPKLFRDCIHDFQLECFRDLAPALHALRDGEMPECRRFWIERTKKSSKDADLAICLLWLIAFVRRPFLVQVCAANKKQAGIIKRRIAALIHFNYWLADLVKIQQNRVISAEGEELGQVVIESTDTDGGAHGETPDLLILNELVHVARWPVMETHMNNASGVPRGVVIVSTNAGIKGTKAHTWRESFVTNRDPQWHSHVWSEASPWLNPKDIEAMRKLDPIGSEYRRLWEGVWVTGAGDAIDEQSIDRAFILDGPLEEREQGWFYIGGLDLGVSRDHAGVSVLGVNPAEQRVRVAYIRAFVPSVKNDKGTLEVDSHAVERTCIHLWRTFLIDWFGYDPAAGGSFMAQRLRRAGLPMREWTFASPSNTTDMAQSFVQLLKDGKLECYDDEEGRLRRDFKKFFITYKPPSTYKLEAVSDETGHADVGVATIIPMPQAIERLKYWEGLTPDDVLYNEDDEKVFNEEELERLPLEMREVYDTIKPVEATAFDDFDGVF